VTRIIHLKAISWTTRCYRYDLILRI